MRLPFRNHFKDKKNFSKANNSNNNNNNNFLSNLDLFLKHFSYKCQKIRRRDIVLW